MFSFELLIHPDHQPNMSDYKFTRRASSQKMAVQCVICAMEMRECTERGEALGSENSQQREGQGEFPGGQLCLGSRQQSFCILGRRRQKM